jgi:hypothetical protein
MPERKLKFKISEQDLVDMTEDLALNSQNAAARIAAIKLLRRMRAEAKPLVSDFDVLDELAARRQAN